MWGFGWSVDFDFCGGLGLIYHKGLCVGGDLSGVVVCPTTIALIKTCPDMQSFPYCTQMQKQKQQHNHEQQHDDDYHLCIHCTYHCHIQEIASAIQFMIVVATMIRKSKTATCSSSLHRDRLGLSHFQQLTHNFFPLHSDNTLLVPHAQLVDICEARCELSLLLFVTC